MKRAQAVAIIQQWTKKQMGNSNIKVINTEIHSGNDYWTKFRLSIDNSDIEREVAYWKHYTACEHCYIFDGYNPITTIHEDILPHSGMLASSRLNVTLFQLYKA